MTKTALIPVALTVALAGCSITVPTVQPGLANLQAQAQPQVTAKTEASLPFKTVAVDPEGQGGYFKAGASEAVVLRSKADLDAFIARHEAAVKPQYGPPNPSASIGPPSGIPFGTPEPPYKPQPLPETLTKLDFSKYTAIALFDGDVKVATSERITAVQDQGDRLVVTAQRWDPPPNPDAIPDLNGRLHVIALPRTDKPVTFTPATVVDGTSPTGGGYSIGGNPYMLPRWRAVPNPDVTREMVEQSARAWVRGGEIKSLDLQLLPLSASGFDPNQIRSFTPDSLVWVARINGSVSVGLVGGPSPGIGGGPDTYGETLIVLSPEDGQLISAFTKGPAMKNPGFGFHLKPDGDLHIGDMLTFETSGVAPTDGSLHLTISAEGKQPEVHDIAYKDLAAFHLFLDPAHVPVLTGEAVQTITIELKYSPQPGQNGAETHTVKVAKDGGAKPTPPQPVQGSGSIADYHLQPGETAADAFVRMIATDAWQGTNLTYTSTLSTIRDVHPKGREAIDLDPATPCRVYVVKGTFPTFFVQALTSTTDKDEVMAPDHLEIAVTEKLPIRVVAVKAFPR